MPTFDEIVTKTWQFTFWTTLYNRPTTLYTTAL